MNKINQDVSAALIEKNYDIANVWLKLHEYINEAYEENREIVEYIESNASDDIEDDITGDLME